MIKKYILGIVAIVCCLSSCDVEDESVDITIMPEVTTTGADTFGCLVDGWVYVGGRFYKYEGQSDEWWSSVEFNHSEPQNVMKVQVWVKKNMAITFTIQSPEEGKETTFTDAYMGDEELSDGTVKINRFDTREHIISGTFQGNRITNGRFDVHYKVAER